MLQLSFGRNKKGLWLNRFTRLLVFGFIVSTSIVASAAQAAAASLPLPDYIGVLEFVGERTARGVHVERSYSYRAVGLSLDIDVFDFNATHLSSGVESPVLRSQYEKAKAQACASAPRRAKLLGETVVELGTRQRFPAREAVYRLTHADFEQTHYLWLAAAQGRLLEMRFSVQEGFEEDGRVSRSEILASLGEAVAHMPVAQDSASRLAEVPRVNVAIEWDPATPAAEKQLWMTYLMTRAAQAAKESADRELPLGERQASFEEEVRARTMAVAAFRSLKARGPKLASRYFDDLERVEAAGFLSEYTWRYLHHESWSAPPPGLNLKGFDAWRAAHLTDHVVVTHGRIALRLATAQ